MDDSATPTKSKPDRKPDWLKVRAPGGESYARIKQTLRGLELHTVCEEAHCPNVGECWSKGTATVMILGDTCTRGCRFCAVQTGNPRGMVDPREPEHVARAIAKLGLRYVVLTMVDRDDLRDGGAEHVAQTLGALRRVQPDLIVETLVGDFCGRRGDVSRVLTAKPEVFAHNIEVVRRLTPLVRDPRCDYDRSLEVLAMAKQHGSSRYVKSSLMVGLGETDEEVIDTMQDLRGAKVDILTIGQYLRPTARHAEVCHYHEPKAFRRWQAIGQDLGFAFVASGPLVRSSYHAAEAFVAAAVGSPAVVPSGLPVRDVTGLDGAEDSKPAPAPTTAGIVEVSRLTGPRR